MGLQRTLNSGFVQLRGSWSFWVAVVAILGVCVFFAGRARAQNVVAAGSYSDSAPLVIPQDPNPSAAFGWNQYD